MDFKDEMLKLAKEAYTRGFLDGVELFVEGIDKLHQLGTPLTMDLLKTSADVLKLLNVAGSDKYEGE